MDADGHPAHDLDAAGDGDVDHARADEGGGQVGGLLRRPALGVDRGGGDGHGQAGGEPGGAGDVERLLADLADAAADDLADLGRVDAGAVDRLPLDCGEEIGRVHGGQAAVAAPDGRADGFDDDDLRHDEEPTRLMTERRNAQAATSVWVSNGAG